MGKDVTVKAVSQQLVQSIRPIGKLQKAFADSGLNPQDVDLKIRDNTVKQKLEGPESFFFLIFHLLAQHSTSSISFIKY